MGTRGIAEDLNETDILAGLPPMQRQAALGILMAGPMERIAEGESVPLRTGTSGIAIVKSGEVLIIATTEDERPLVIGRVREGEVFACPPQGIERGGVVLEATRRALICGIDRDQLDALTRYPSVLVNLLGACVSRIEEAQSTSLRLAHRKVEDRVLLALRDLAARDGRVTPSGVRIPHIRHRDLARLANVTRPGATQALARLEEEGRIRRAADGSLILDSVPSGASCATPDARSGLLARLLRR